MFIVIINVLLICLGIKRELYIYIVSLRYACTLVVKVLFKLTVLDGLGSEASEGVCRTKVFYSGVGSVIGTTFLPATNTSTMLRSSPVKEEVRETNIK